MAEVKSEGKGTESPSSIINRVLNDMARHPVSECLVITLDEKTGLPTIYQSSGRHSISIGLLEAGKKLLLDEWMR